MKLKKYPGLLLGALVTVAACAAPAMAADMTTAGWYAGLGLGQSKAGDVCADLPATFVGTCDDKDYGFKIFGGYEFNRHFSVEAGYVDLGKANLSGTDLGVAVNGDWDTSGWELVGIGTIPINDQLGLYGKLGFFRWTVDVSGAVVGLGTGSTSDNGTDLTYGLGLKYDFTKKLGARLEWQRYDSVGNDVNTGQSDINLLSVGIIMKF